MRVKREVVLRSHKQCHDNDVHSFHGIHGLRTNQFRASQPDSKPSPVKKGDSPKVASDDNSKNDDTENNNNNAINHSTRNEETYSAEDNAKIIALKAENKSWQQIADAIGKASKSQISAHWRLNLGPNAEAEQKKQAEKAAKAEKNKAEGLGKQAEEGEKKAGGEGGGGEGAGGDGGGGKKKNRGGGGGGGGGTGEGSKNKGEEKAKAKEVCSLPPKKGRLMPSTKACEQESKEDKETPASLTKQNLQTFVKKYEREKWLAAASRHYDLTGQRISPEAAKKIFEQK
jgi:hypothetical protein